MFANSPSLQSHTQTHTQSLQLPNPEVQASRVSIEALWKKVQAIPSLDGRRPDASAPQLFVAVDPNCPHTADIVRQIVQPLAKDRGGEKLSVVLLVAGTRQEAEQFASGVGVIPGRGPIVLADTSRGALSELPVSTPLRSGTMELVDGKGNGWLYPTTTRNSLRALHQKASDAVGARLQNPADKLSDGEVKRLYLGCQIITPEGSHRHDQHRD